MHRGRDGVVGGIEDGQSQVSGTGKRTVMTASAVFTCFFPSSLGQQSGSAYIMMDLPTSVKCF